MTTTNRNCCLICGKEKATYQCDGCLRRFCKNHLQDHQKELELQLDGIENERNIFRQTLSEQTNEQPLIQQINEWERRSIEKIKNTAEENRQLILEQTNEHFEKIEIGLKRLTDEIKETRQENDFNELNLNDLKDKLEQLRQQLHHPANVSLKEDISSLFINKIYVDMAHRKLIDFENHMKKCLHLEMLNIPLNSKWKQNAITIAGGNGQGEELNQLHRPWSIYIDEDKTIYLADCHNHRIVAWTKDATCGQFIVGGNQKLCFPSKVILDKMNDCFIIGDYANKRVIRCSRRNTTHIETIINDVKCVDLILYRNKYLYVCDEDKHEVRRWKLGTTENVLIAGGNGDGNSLNQFNKPRFIFIDPYETLYVSDFRNHRIMKWPKGAKEGIIVAGGSGDGHNLKQLSYPQGIFVDRFGTLYVADSCNDRIVRWIKGAEEGSIIAGENNRTSQSNHLNNPIGLSFDNENNLYVVDHQNHRIQKFLIDE